MSRAAEHIRHFAPGDVETWYQANGRRIFLADVIDASNGETMSVGFARYAPGDANEWVVTYDEALIVTRGSFRVTSADGVETSADVGELIFLDRGIRVVYSAGDAGAEVVYVTYPHWMDAQRESEHAALLDGFHPVPRADAGGGDRERADNVALLREIWDPIARGESDDIRPFFDALAEDVVFELPVGTLRGRREVIAYFGHASETIEFQPFERPLEYFGAGDRIVMLGEETFRIRKTGATHRAEWAWVHDLQDGLITRIVAIQDLTGIAETVRAAVAKAQQADGPAARVDPTAAATEAA